MCRYSFPEGQINEVRNSKEKKINQMNKVGC